MKSSMSPTLKRYIVTYDNGKSLKLFATNPMNAMTLGSIVSDKSITEVRQAIVQMSINKVNPN